MIQVSFTIGLMLIKHNATLLSSSLETVLNNVEFI